MGLDAGKLDNVLPRIARPIADIGREAAVQRASGEAVAYKPSILRQYPCILFSLNGRRMRAPLPELISNRVTAGLFYDVIGGGGSIRDDYGPRFEAYAHSLISAMLPGVRVERQWPYRMKGGQCWSPDILISNSDGSVRFAIECKADWMGINARFGEDPSGERGYEEIAKGIIQAWRFFAHSRVGLTNRAISTDAKCIVLTLHEWFAGRSKLLEKVLQRANELADGAKAKIDGEDRRPVAFCTISELETVFRTATEASFFGTVDMAASEERRGWIFSTLHADSTELKTEPKGLPL